MFKVPEKTRITAGMFATDEHDGNNGSFIIKNPFTRNGKPEFTVFASDGEGWEHVSVSFSFRTPTWEEMCFIKNMFWDEEDTVIQIHPPRSQYVNQHEFTLHLWRPAVGLITMPHADLVGIVGNDHEQGE